MSNIRVEIQLEDGSFTSGVMRAGQTLAEFKRELQRTNPHFDQLANSGRTGFLMFKRAEDSTRSFTKSLRDVSIIMGGVSIAFAALSGASSSTIGNIIRINAEMEKLKYQLAGMSNAADPMREAADQVARLQDFASSTPFSLGALSNSFVKLKAAGIDQANGSLRALTDGLAAFGASDEQLNRVTVAITQMQGKGVISMEELRQQLGESMPSAMKLMARSMGVSVGELSKLISSGMVESRSALDKWFKEVELSYGGMGEMMTQTFSGQLAKINTAFQKLVTGGEMGRAFDDLKQRMGSFAEYLGSSDARSFFDSIGSGLQLLIDVGGRAAVMLQNIRDIIEWLGPAIPAALGGALLIGAMSRTLRMMHSMKVSAIELSTAYKTVKGSAVDALRSLTAAGSAAAVATQQAAAAGGAAAAGAAGAAAGAAGAVGAATTATSRFLLPLATIGSRLLGLLGPIAMGVTVLGPLVWEVAKGIRDWWQGADKAKDSIDGVVDTTAEKLQGLRERQAEEAKKLARELESARRIAEAKDLLGGDVMQASRQRLYQQKLQERVEMERRHQQEMTNLVEEQEDQRYSLAKKRIDAQARESSRAYSIAMDESAQRYERELAAAAENGSSVRDVRSDFQARTIELRAKRMGDMLKLYDAEIERMRKLADEGKESYGALARLLEDRMRIEEQIKDLQPEDLTVKILTAPEDDKSKTERLKRYFDSARDKVQELNAELNGASGAVAKLAFQIRRGDFGNLENATDEVKKMMNLLMETTIQAEALDEAFKALNKVESTIDGITTKMREEIVKNLAIADGIDIEDPLAFYKYQKERGIGIFEDIGRTGEETFIAFGQKVTQGIDLAITSADRLGAQIRENTFGNAAVERINEVDAALKNVLQTTNSIGSSMSGLDFASMAMPSFKAKTDGGILDLIASVESGGDYNATLDNGRWTGGPQNLTSMSLRNIYALQQRMLANPANRAKYQGIGSSALGKYQIVSKTLKGLIEEMGLSWDTLFSEDVQDQMAMRLLARRGRNPAQLRNEWQGLNNVSDADILGAWDRSASGPTRFAAETSRQNTTSAPVRPTGDSAASLDAKQQSIAGKEAEAEALLPQYEASIIAANTQKFLDEIEDSAAALRNGEGDLEKFGTMGQKARRAANAGEFGTDSEQIADILRRADAIDEETAKLKERGQAAKNVAQTEKKLNEDLVELEERRQAALAKAKNPYALTKSDDLIKLATVEAEQLALIEKIQGGKDNDAYRSAQERFAKQRQAVIGAESAEALQQLSRAADDAAKSAIRNERDLRKREFDERIRELEALRDRAIRDGALVAEAQKQFDRAVAAERAKYNAENQTELQKSLEQMGKLGQNISRESANWGKAFSDNLYEVISGQTNSFSKIGDTIREGIARSLTDKAASTFLKPFEKLLGGDGTDGSGIGGMIEKSLNNLISFDFSGIQNMLKSALSGVSNMLSSMFQKSGFFPVKHTGGIVGHGGGWGRSAPVSAFLGAPKFHTGGIIGGPKFRTGLNPSEVPIIAQKGEGIFTPEQMKHLGGSVNSQQIAINAPITVNGSAGTPEQNADLAQQIARESEQTFRKLIQDEIVKQTRNGGLLKR